MLATHAHNLVNNVGCAHATVLSLWQANELHEEFAKFLHKGYPRLPEVVLHAVAVLKRVP
jgi:hypothetical protein